MKLRKIEFTKRSDTVRVEANVKEVNSWIKKEGRKSGCWSTAGEFYDLLGLKLSSMRNGYDRGILNRGVAEAMVQMGAPIKLDNNIDIDYKGLLEISSRNDTVVVTFDSKLLLSEIRERGRKTGLWSTRIGFCEYLGISHEMLSESLSRGIMNRGLARSLKKMGFSIDFEKSEQISLDKETLSSMAIETIPHALTRVEKILQQIDELKLEVLKLSDEMIKEKYS